jgi:hypothetical protein
MIGGISGSGVVITIGFCLGTFNLEAMKVLKAGVFIFPGLENEVLEHWEAHVSF